MDATIRLEVPASAGSNTRRFFEGVTTLAEREDKPITSAIKEWQRLHPREFLEYLVEQGILTRETAEGMEGWK